MKKTIIAICIVTILLCGCGAVSTQEDNTGTYIDNFVCVERNSSSFIYVDRNTKVMYWGDTVGPARWMTAILNADGTPMLWEGDLK